MNQAKKFHQDCVLNSGPCYALVKRFPGVNNRSGRPTGWWGMVRSTGPGTVRLCATGTNHPTYVHTQISNTCTVTPCYTGIH